MHLLIYLLLGVVQIVFVALAYVFFAFMIVNACRKIHQMILGFGLYFILCFVFQWESELYAMS